MATRQNEDSSLVSSVNAVLRNYNSGDFFDYWELVQETLEVPSFKEFYIYFKEAMVSDNDSDGTDYINVVVLTDGLLIDAEGGLTRNDNPASSADFGEFNVLSLSSISAVQFHRGPIQTLERSANAKLILIADISGRERLGRFWIADTDCEYRSLLAFGKALIGAIESSATNRMVER